METIDIVRHKARKLYKKLGNWRLVGSELGITGGMAYRLANEPGYEPKGAHVRYILGLPALIPVPVCQVCGEVHIRRRCPKRAKSKTPRRIAIRVDDMHSAAGTILRNLEPCKVKALVSILENDNEHETIS